MKPHIILQHDGVWVRGCAGCWWDFDHLLDYWPFILKGTFNSPNARFPL